MNFIEHVHEPRRLLLVWQGPEGSSRTRHTIAELVRVADDRVRFHYLCDSDDFKTAQAEGFVNFPAFRKLDQDYDLGIVETFMRRLPPSSRGDYAQYLEQFRLRPETVVSDFGLLGYTGAKLPSDGFSLINPLDDVVGSCDVLVEVAGFRHTSELPVDALREGDLADFAPEPGNIHDTNALAIRAHGRKIGYVPRQQAVAICNWQRAAALQAHIERVNGRPERPLIYLFVRARGVGAMAPPHRRSGG